MVPNALIGQSRPSALRPPEAIALSSTPLPAAAAKPAAAASAARDVPAERRLSGLELLVTRWRRSRNGTRSSAADHRAVLAGHR
jgi:hypothetical protein